MNINIQYLDPDDRTALLKIYPNQSKPQDCYLALDLEDGTLQASYNAEIGNAVPEAVWHNRILRFPIPPLTPQSANDLMDHWQGQFQRIADGSEIAWNGSNHVGRLNEDAQQAAADLRWELERLDGDLYWEDARDYLHLDEGDLVQQLHQGVTVDALFEDLSGDGSSEDRPILVGLYDYLQDLRQMATV